MTTHHDLEKYDKAGMHKVYDIWPELAGESYKKNLDKIDFRGVDNIILIGMGDSGTIEDALSAILSKTGIHLCAVKGHHLQKVL
ncbi:MAG: hypothetical protein KGH89_00520 [Thaumarchaeota archaeon]|nr:hypothetical protein [Nitrososphaerota archaeon]MDE1867107.1 hypothetical protein [Nitrososphaerota archaeon]